MSEHKQELEKRLWSIANELRGNMGADEFRDYILGFIFFKFLSEKMEIFALKELEGECDSFAEAAEDPELMEDLKEEAVESLGYFIEPQHLFHNIAARARNKGMIIEDLGRAMKAVEESALGHDSEQDFTGLFEDVDLTSTKLGRTVEQKNRLISEVIKHLDEINFKFEDTELDILGDAYEYLIGEFASGAGKKAGEFYTPQQVSKILAKLVTLGKDKIKTVYDPTCGSGSLLLRVARESKVSFFYGQELNTTTYNLARMNMILHNVRFKDFEIEQGDTLEEPHHLDKRFEAVVANPPFSANWSANQTFLSDERFSAYGKLAPKTKADFAFVQHMIHQLDENGTMATVLPHGVLFRGAAEGVIRQYLIEEKNYLDAVIGLPANIFYGTSIPTCVLVFKKCRQNPDNVMFIDASNYFEKAKNQNYLRDEDVERIIDTYRDRAEVEKFSHVATMDEIRENDYNLNIPRYVDTFEEEEPVDLGEVAKAIKALDKDISAIDEEIKGYCEELGIEAPMV
ncbi:type I restriction-modification system subunit M [uncultured Ilyobacter sp.]|uniref:type I restriction-modification system subunit M n=1 Tax=uncultured Ilyobacter sp. TaxID=544433 RepID=UPI0029C0D3C8|nr:type I restriction-modification system subunit M [uncultured Ilyobacter sp.]